MSTFQHRRLLIDEALQEANSKQTHLRSIFQKLEESSRILEQEHITMTEREKRNQETIRDVSIENQNTWVF